MFCNQTSLYTSLRTNKACSRRNVPERYDKKYLISTKLFYRASMPRVTTDTVIKARKRFFSLRFWKRGFDDGGNTNSARKAWHVLSYTKQWLNRRRKPQAPMNKLKEAEFWYMLQESFYWGAELPKKSQNMVKLLN